MPIQSELSVVQLLPNRSCWIDKSSTMLKEMVKGLDISIQSELGGHSIGHAELANPLKLGGICEQPIDL